MASTDMLLCGSGGIIIASHLSASAAAELVRGLMACDGMPDTSLGDALSKAGRAIGSRDDPCGFARVPFGTVVIACGLIDGAVLRLLHGFRQGTP